MSEVTSTIEKALGYKARYEALLGEAKEEALLVIHEQLTELKQLGFSYQVVEVSASAVRNTKRGADRQRGCKVCGQPGHNSRTCPKKMS